MILSRFSSDQVLNNVILIAIYTGSLLLAALLALTTLAWLVRRATRASRYERLKSLGEQTSKALRVFGTAFALLLVVGACATLASAIYFGLDLQEWTNRGAGLITMETALHAARSVTITAGALASVLIARLLFRRVLVRTEAKLLAFEPLSGREASIKLFTERLGGLVSTIAFYASFYLAESWLSLPSGLRWLIVTLLNVILIIRTARVAVLLVHLALAGLDQMGSTRLSLSRFEAYYKGTRELLPLAQITFEAIVYLAAVTLVVRQFETLETFAPYGPRIIGLLAIFLAARVVVELTRVLVYESFTRTSGLLTQVAKRRITLIYLIQSVVKYVIYFGALLMMMRQVGVDPTPFLAGAGIVGLTMGLGSQKLVNDMVSGFFILFEGQLLTGDYVQIGTIEGDVESVQLRVTTIRDWLGRLHTVRNGEIGTTMSYSRDYVYAVCEIHVPYDSDLSLVFKATEEAGARMRKLAPDQILTDIEVWGVAKFDKHGMLIRAVLKLVPGTPYIIEYDFRKVLKDVFDERGVRVAHEEHIAVRFANGKHARQVLGNSGPAEEQSGS